MKSIFSINILVIFVAVLAIPCTAQNVDFFDFIQQWPGSYCDTKEGCCYPKSGKPASDFIVYGLQPYSNGTRLLNCDPKSPFVPLKVAGITTLLQKYWPSLTCPSVNGMEHWANEWKQFGTCSALNQHKYFKAAVNLRKKVNLLKILKTAGIRPNGKFYELSRISDTIIKAVGHEPGFQCNVDKSGNTQLLLISLCANPQGSQIIECPGLAMNTCKKTIKFPKF
ncbi:hypothetical protein AQUCO_06000044v1 [Aquilegia coerulea]|uniref:Uncharacterized protein n=1 Tax=Aquilegia coerulea TaxID=218851 RepID=A0A2G5CDR4_AQUCA|nr:hypothetical protein AQUCO_06000044v1 [Aquilegia coerulea]